MITINYLAVAACGVLSMGLGTLWYGPLFGKPWMKMMGISKGEMNAETKKAMMKSYSLMFAGSLITAFVFAHVLDSFAIAQGTSGISAGLMGGFWMWIGFMAPVTLGSTLWEGKPWKLFAINSGYNLVFLMLSGVILSLWV
jgi:hypothetical protein